MIPMLIASRDRPLFLDAYLQTLSDQPFSLTVAYRAGVKYQDAYAELKDRYPAVEFCNHDSISLYGAIRRWLRQDDGLCVLSVDDNLCIAPIDEWKIRGAMEDISVFGFSLRLQNGIRGKRFDPENGIIEWDPSEFSHKHSWGYPWEFSSTVYRKDTIERVMRHCPTTSKPNAIEVIGMSIFRGRVRKMKCFERAAMVNVFVDSHRNVKFEHGLTCEQALDLYKQGKRLDVERYAKEMNRIGRMHVTEVFLK